MPALNVINKIILVENVACVFRNYLYFGPKTKFVVKLVIVLSVALYFYSFIEFHWTIVNVLKFSNRVGYCMMLMYNLFSKMNTITAMVLGVVNSQSFKNYVAGVEAVYELCNHDVLYLNYMTKLNKRIKVVAIFYAGIGITLITGNVMNNTKFLNHENRIFFDLFFDALITFRYIIESLAFYVYIEVIVADLKYLNDAVSAAVTKFKRQEEDVREIQDFLKLGKDLEHWGMVSGLLVGCSDELKTCFGLQIGLSLISAVLYYIILIYQCVSILADKKMMETEWTSSSLLTVLLSYVSVKILLTSAGQRAHSETDRLGTSVVALRSLLVGIPGREAAECARATTALGRRLRTAPLRVRLVSKNHVEMALLVELFTVVANFTIVLLQFNHVV